MSMSTEQQVAKMLKRLNRPEEDDLFSYPGEYYEALSDAHRYFYKKVCQMRPDILIQSATLTSTDGGNTFTLTDAHFGELEVYRSPGPPNGVQLVPSLPGGAGHYYTQGRNLMFNSPYVGTLHIRWTPATVADLDEESNSQLPAYIDEAMNWWACYLMAQKPGFLGDPAVFHANALREWAGDPSDPSDMGVIGIIKRQSAHQAYEGNDEYDTPWWRGIGSG